MKINLETRRKARIEMLPLIDFTDKSTFLLIGEWNIRQLSRLAARKWRPTGSEFFAVLTAM